MLEQPLEYLVVLLTCLSGPSNIWSYYTHMLERPLEDLVSELVAGASPAGGQVTHVLQHGVEAHARLLPQFLLKQRQSE